MLICPKKHPVFIYSMEIEKTYQNLIEDPSGTRVFKCFIGFEDEFYERNVFDRSVKTAVPGTCRWRPREPLQ